MSNISKKKILCSIFDSYCPCYKDGYCDGADDITDVIICETEYMSYLVNSDEEGE